MDTHRYPGMVYDHALWHEAIIACATIDDHGHSLQALCYGNDHALWHKLITGMTLGKWACHVDKGVMEHVGTRRSSTMWHIMIT
jgi:hypothetical protein